MLGLGLLAAWAGILQTCRAGVCSFSVAQPIALVGIALLVIGLALGVLRLWPKRPMGNRPGTKRNEGLVICVRVQPDDCGYITHWKT